MKTQNLKNALEFLQRYTPCFCNEQRPDHLKRARISSKLQSQFSSWRLASALDLSGAIRSPALLVVLFLTLRRRRLGRQQPKYPAR